MKTQKNGPIALLIVLGLLGSACGSSEAEATPTVGVPAIQTAAVATFAGGLTQTALVAPTKTATQSSTPPPTISASTLANVTPFGAGVVGNPTAACYGMAYVADVTIPDSTAMTPGQAFTKTWKVRNSGTCAWDAGFKFAFTGGDNMNGAAYTLPQSVPANTEINLSIAMTAPTNKAGALRSNWRMSNAAGQFFGNEVYVLIQINGTGGAGPASNTPGAGSTSTTAPAGTATTAPPTATGTP